MTVPKRITQIPFPGGSGETPTGAMQFKDDWPGLFIRGDSAYIVAGAIRELQSRLAEHPDGRVASALTMLARYADIIEQDVLVRA